MFKRLSRMLRSFFGFFISVAENPEIILEQNIRDMNDQVPRMNESIAMVKANATLLEKEEASYKNDINDLTAKIKAAIQAGRDDLAGSFATQLEQVAARSPAPRANCATATAAFDKAIAVKKAFMLEKDRKTHEALGAIARLPPRRNGRRRWPTSWSSSKSRASAPRTTRWSAKSRRPPP